MATKAFLVLFAQVFLIKAALSQCLNREGFFPGAFGCAPGIEITATSGGNLPVTSSSINPPTGLFVASENVYEGRLATAGELPFVGTAAVDSVLPTAGAGAVNYGCGNGITDIFTETIPAAAAFSPAGITAPIGVASAAVVAPAAAVAPAFARPAAFGFTAPGCGCGAFY